MSGDFILNSFSSFGTSTKRDKDSKKRLVGFGIGAKSLLLSPPPSPSPVFIKGSVVLPFCTKDGLAPSILCLERMFLMRKVQGLQFVSMDLTVASPLGVSRIV